MDELQKIMKLESANEKTLFSTIRIETRLEHNEFVSGTSFVYEFATEDNTYPFLVTARNLIETAQEGRITLIQGQNRSPILGKGYTLDIENFSKLWFCHPDDSLNVAVTPFVPFVKHVENTGVNIYFDSFTESSIFPSNKHEKLTIGDEVLYLGYPKNCWDEKHLLPVFRKGMLALPFTMAYQGKSQSLLDAQITEGSCGSPVFLKSQFKSNSIQESLLGILSNIPEKETDEDGHTTLREDARMETPMGVVIKTEIIIEAITAYLLEKGFI